MSVTKEKLRENILSLLQERGKLSVSDLTRMLGYKSATGVRYQIDLLEELHKVQTTMRPCGNYVKREVRLV